MTPQQFVAKWSDSQLKESAAAKEHFIDLCRMLGERTPSEADSKGEWYAFEKGVLKTGGGDGWADVWKKGCFAWEYKSKGRDLGAALKQLKTYAGSLENPPLLIVSDMETIEIHTNWTNMVQEVHVLTFDDLLDARRRQLLSKAFSETGVEELKPGRKRADLTADVAKEFVILAQSLRERGHPPDAVAHFVNRLLFCMFAESVGLLPEKLFRRLLELTVRDPESFAPKAQRLFAAMAKPRGTIDFESVEWFNGGLFDDDHALPLTTADIRVIQQASHKDWSNIDPSIMGTLFERGLDPEKRGQLGAHYTDPDKIMQIVGPVVVDPLTREWEGRRAEIAARMELARAARSPAVRTRHTREAASLMTSFIERLRNFRVLDPACGSGNFLYLTLKALKDLEHRVNADGEQLGLPRGFPVVGPENLLGIEINPFAAELARVSVWIGEIQWMREHGFDATRNPILRPLDTIQCRSAVFDAGGRETEWPAADAIVGNPPFLGGKLLRTALGDAEVQRMFTTFADRVPAEADLVCYWFAKSREQIEAGKAQRAGLVTTNSIRGGANRAVLDDIAESGRIFAAWSDEPWVIDGAAVRVSLVCFDRSDEINGLMLDGRHVEQINTDLTSTKADLTKVARLSQNAGIAFMGDTKGGAFDIPGELAREWLLAPVNPNGRPNSDVLKPWINGMDITRRPAGKWIIDFGWTMTEEEAALYEKPFQHVLTHVKPMRATNKREQYAKYWWRHVEARQGMSAEMLKIDRFLATPRVSKHRSFAWFDTAILPDSRIFAFARSDDLFFGMLSSKCHELWALATCSWHGVGNDPTYNATTCFETFPFPVGLTPDIPASDYEANPRAAAIAAAASRLGTLRDAWLNPPDLVERKPEVVAGFPDRLVAADEKADKELRRRTLTNLYNERPAWLVNAHRDLDAAVAAAYGWPADLSDEQVLEKLLALNVERSSH